MQDCLDIIYKEIDKLYYEARSAYEKWLTIVAERELQRTRMELNKRERTNYELRLEFSENSFRCRWFKVEFHRHHTTKKLKKIYTAIAEPESGNYGKGKFRSANEWELELIMYAEVEFAPIRNKVKHLMKAHRNILYAAKAGNIKVEVKPQVTRVEKTELTISSIKKRMTS
jgi:hypothetical protein